ARPINHQSGSHGVPGIYFKYDMSFVKVKVTVEKHSTWRFLVRLCGIIGGVFATSGRFLIGKSTYCNGSHDTTFGKFLQIFTDHDP
ncbi:hypothetical protein AVEN_42095-1, partial [Araneus ventricosus]